MEFWDVLEQECKRHNTTVTSLLKSLNLSPNKGTKWRNGSKPNGDDLLKISNAFSISVDYLLTGKTSNTRLTHNDKVLLSLFHQLPDEEQKRFIGRCEEIADRINEAKEKRKKISITPVRVYAEAAGAGISNPFSDDDVYQIYNFQSDIVPVGTDCGVRINGDSMEPDYPDGCIVWVNRKIDIQYGDCVIAIVNGSPFFKLFQKDGLHSINPSYKPIKVFDGDSFKIFGKVIGFYNETDSASIPAETALVDYK